jgi:Tfp pilus assembly protein PilX
MSLRGRVRRVTGRATGPGGARGTDAGMALVFVLTAMLVLAMLLTAVLAYAVSSQDFSRRDQDQAGAVAAAQAGVDDYLGRLNRDGNYAKQLDCANEALKGRTTTPNSCGWTASTATGWLPVDVSNVTNAAGSFHYSVDGSRQDAEGVVTITSTGRVNGAYRTIEVVVGKGGSTDYLYYTDFESMDPALSGTSRNQCGANGTASAQYAWQGRSGCTEIQFAADDVLDGRMFTNDSVLSLGGRFRSGIESASPDCRDVVTEDAGTWGRCLRSGSTYTAGGPTATFGRAPAYANPLYLPDNSAEFTDRPGCHYYGATRIMFNANGTMTVWSKNSNVGGLVLAVPAAGRPTPNCGTRGNLASAAGATVPLPSDMVIYVDGAPTSVPRRQCHAESIGGPANQRLPLGTYDGNTRTTPTGANQYYTYDRQMAQPDKYCGEGNVYVQGVVKGRVTVAAAQSVVLTGDLVLAGGLDGTDMVGLVAANAVEVMHPRMVTVASEQYCPWQGCTWRWGGPGNEGEAGSGWYDREGTWPKRVADPATGAPNPASGLQIAASIQSLQHSFFVQSWGEGPGKGALLVHGSIAQRWRGPVATTGGSGYAKDYGYDTRLRYSSPPFFPYWANSQWALRSSGEIRTPMTVRTS